MRGSMRTAKGLGALAVMAAFPVAARCQEDPPAAVCAAGKPGQVTTEGPVALRKKGIDTKWKKEGSLEQAVQTAWGGRTWKAVVCIEEKSKAVDAYVVQEKFVGGSTRTVGSAYQVTWDVTVIRLDDGKKYKKKLTAAPPSSTTVRGEFGGSAWGDPKMFLLAWIASSLPR